MAGEEDRRFGTVLFDDPQDPGAGWAAIADDNRGQPRRISGPHELATDTIWWSNISYADFFRGTAQTWRNPNIRHDKFLPVSHVDVLREWGHDPQNIEPDFVASFCSQVFDRIMRIAWSLLREAQPKARMATTLVGKTLRDDLRVLLPELEYPKLEAAEAMKSGQAWEEFTSTGARGPKGAKWILLRRPRLSYAMEMLQTPVPRGPYIFRKRSDIAKLGPNPVEHVRSMSTPAIIEVTVNKIQPEVAPIYGFGAATDRDKRVSRSWVAHPEFQILSRVADITVRSMWQAERYWPMVPVLPEAAKEFLTNRFTDFSWSAGIVAECLWRAVSLAEDKGKAAPGAAGDARASTSWQGLWIRAADKSAMFSLSMRLTELGHAIVSYGLGWVRAQVAEEEIPGLIRDGLGMGLIPNLLDVPEKLITPKNFTWGGDKKSSNLAMLTTARETGTLWHMDRMPLIPPGERSAFIARYQAQRAQQGAARKSA